MAESPIYSFAGGKRDGNRFPVPGHVQVGTIIRLKLVSDPSKAELYQMNPDGAFHFVCYAWVDSNSPQPPAEKAAAAAPAARLQELLQALGAVLDDLNAAFVSRGEFPRGIHVSGWLVQRKEVATQSPMSPPPSMPRKRTRARRDGDANRRGKKDRPRG